MTHTEHHAAMEPCIQACLDCAKTCEECFGECVRMDMPGMAMCIQLCRDCADVVLHKRSAHGEGWRLQHLRPLRGDLRALRGSVQAMRGILPEDGQGVVNVALRHVSAAATSLIT